MSSLGAVAGGTQGRIAQLLMMAVFRGDVEPLLDLAAQLAVALRTRGEASALRPFVEYLAATQREAGVVAFGESLRRYGDAVTRTDWQRYDSGRWYGTQTMPLKIDAAGRVFLAYPGERAGECRGGGYIVAVDGVPDDVQSAAVLRRYAALVVRWRLADPAGRRLPWCAIANAGAGAIMRPEAAGGTS